MSLSTIKYHIDKNTGAGVNKVPIEPIGGIELLETKD